MGLLDIAAKVVTSYKADISDMKSKLKDLQGEEKKLAEEQIKSAESRNKQTDGAIKKLAELGQALNAVTGVVRGAMEAQAAASERARLTFAAQGVDIEKLRTASHGLSTQTELLGDAAKYNNGMIAMTGDQMATAERAIVSFTRKGYEHAKAHDAITKAVTTLKVDGLDDLGLHVDKSGLSMDSARDRAKLYKRVMDELARSSSDVKDGQDLQSEGIQQAGVKLHDAFESVKLSIGELVTSMAPLLKGLADAVGLIADIVKGAKEYAKKNPLGFVMSVVGGAGGQIVGEQLDKIGDAGGISGKNLALGMNASLNFVGLGSNAVNSSQYGGYDNYAPEAWWSGPSSKATADGGIEMPNQNMRRNSNALSADQLKALAEAAKKLAASVSKDLTDALITKLQAEVDSAGPVAGVLRGINKTYSDPNSLGVDTVLGRGGSNSLGFAGSSRAGWDSDVDSALAKFNGAGGELERRTQETRTESFLEKTFGKKEEFEAYQELFSGLTGTIMAAYAAWVDGSMSAGDAAKLFLKQTLASLGQRMALRGVEEFAEGVASLALGPIGGASASAHFGAAALFGAGAAMAGLGSRAISAPAAGGAGAPNVSRGSGGGASSGPSGAVIVIGDSFADDSPRMRQLRAQELVNRALGTGGGGRNE